MSGTTRGSSYRTGPQDQESQRSRGDTYSTDDAVERPEDPVFSNTGSQTGGTGTSNASVSRRFGKVNGKTVYSDFNNMGERAMDVFGSGMASLRGKRGKK